MKYIGTEPPPYILHEYSLHQLKELLHSLLHSLQPPKVLLLLLVLGLRAYRLIYISAKKLGEERGLSPRLFWLLYSYSWSVSRLDLRNYHD